MKKLIFLLCTLMLVPALAAASTDMISMSESGKRTGERVRWSQTYEAYGRVIHVDIPIHIPEEETVNVYDCSAYTEYIRNPNHEDKANVYTYYENLSNLTGKDSVQNAAVDVYDNGTELRVMFNSPEELLVKNPKDHIKTEADGFYPYELDAPAVFAENNDLSLSDAEQYLEEILRFFIQDLYNGVDIDYIKIAGRGRKTRSYTDEKLGECVDYYPKGTYYFYYYQKLHGLPIMMTIINTLNNTQENKVYGDLFGYWARTGGVCQMMDRNSFWLTIKWMKIEKEHEERVQLLPLEQIIDAVEKEILAGHVRNVYSLKLGYLIYLNEESPETYTLYPMWVLDCDYVADERKEVKVNPYSQETRDCFSFERICIDPQSAEMVEFMNPKTSMLYAP